MPMFRPLSISATEARKLAAATGLPAANNIDWCIAGLNDTELNWRWFVPSLRDSHMVHRELANRVLELAVSPAASSAAAARSSISPALLRLRAGLALLWLDNNAGLDIVLEAIDGSDSQLRSAALQGIAEFSFDVSWTDHAYKALFDSCHRIFDSASGSDCMNIVSAMFDRPLPALAGAMREVFDSARDFRRHRAAMWLLNQGHHAALASYVAEVVNAPLPASRADRKSWYESVQNLMRQMKDSYANLSLPESRAWVAATVLALLDSVICAAQVETEAGIGVSTTDIWFALHTVAKDIPPEAIPLLERWVQMQRPGSQDRVRALGTYSRHAGEAAVDVLLAELTHYELNQQGSIAGFLTTIAPASRYAELAPTVRVLLDAIPPQEEESYGYSPEQEALAALSSALAQLDPGAGPHIRSRLRELGPTQIRQVKWALAGLTPARIGFLLAVGGAIQPMSRRELQSFHSSGELVRSMLSQQKRLATFNSHDDDSRSQAQQVVSMLAQIAVPPLELEAVTEERDGAIRFIHAGTAYELSGEHDEDYVGTAAAFNQFLAYIQHPQRVFEIYNDGSETDHDAAAFFCADPKRMPAAAAQIEFPVRSPG